MKLYGKANEVAQRIIDAFKQPDSLPQALAPIFIRRKDDIPSTKWSWSNQLIMVLNGTADARGIKQWNSVGRKVKKGCHAVWILAPCTKKIKDKNEQGEETLHQILYGFRSVPVFAVEDTKGEALPERDEHYDSWVKTLPLMEVAEAWSINVGTYSHGSGNPLGYYSYANTGNQAIMLGVENNSTWAHELIHAADHKVSDLKGDKWHKEIVAELGGAILLECLGMPHDADLGGAFDYIQRYAQTAKKDTVKACIEVLDRTCNCVALILDTADQLQPKSISA